MFSKATAVNTGPGDPAGTGRGWGPTADTDDSFTTCPPSPSQPFPPSFQFPCNISHMRTRRHTHGQAHTHSQQPDLGDLGSERNILKGSLARKSPCVPSDIRMTLTIREISWGNRPDRTGPWPPHSLQAKNRPSSPSPFTPSSSSLPMPSFLGPTYLCKGPTACRTPGWGREPSRPA